METNYSVYGMQLFWKQCRKTASSTRWLSAQSAQARKKGTDKDNNQFLQFLRSKLFGWRRPSTVFFYRFLLI